MSKETIQSREEKAAAITKEAREIDHWKPGGKLAAEGASADKRARGIKPAQQTTRLIHKSVVQLKETFRNGAIAETGRGQHFLFLSVFLGMGAAAWFALDDAPQAWTILASGCLVLLVLWRTPRGHPLYFLASFALVFLTGMLLAQAEVWRQSTVILDSPVTAEIEGRIIDLERARSNRWRYTLQVISITQPKLKRPPGKVRITGLAPKAQFAPGDIITGRARLSPPSGPVYPGGHDFAFSSYFGGIGAVGFFYGYPGVQNTVFDVEGPSAFGLIAQAQAATSQFLVSRMSKVLSGDSLAFASAITVNDRRALSRSAINALRDSGLAHIIAISGLHMALAGGMFFWTFRAGLALFPKYAERHSVKKAAAIGALVAASIYLFLAGAPVSATRAFIMLAVMLIAVVAGRSALNLRNLAIAALVIITASPSAVMSPGFIMSFAATAALIAAYKVWRPSGNAQGSGRFGLERSFGLLTSFILGIALTSVVGAGATALFAAATFNSLPTYGLLANILVMPLFSLVAMPAAFLAMIMVPFGLEAPFLQVLGFALDTSLTIAHWVASLNEPWITGEVPAWMTVFGAFAVFAACIFRSPLLRLPVLVGYIVMVAAAIAGIGSTAPPNLLIYEDGRLMALVSGQTATFNRERPSSFVVNQWQKALKLTELQKPQLVEDNRPAQYMNSPIPLSKSAEPKLSGSAEGVYCLPKQWCMAKLKNGLVVMNIEDKTQLGFACDAADIVVSPWRHAYKKCRSGARIFDADIFRRNGSIAIRLSSKSSAATPQEGYVIETAMAGRNRAWTKHRLFNWRSEKFEAPARFNLNDSAE